MDDELDRDDYERWRKARKEAQMRTLRSWLRRLRLYRGRRLARTRGETVHRVPRHSTQSLVPSTY